MSDDPSKPDLDPATPDGPEPHVPPVLGWSWMRPGADLAGFEAGMEMWRQALQPWFSFWTAGAWPPKPPPPGGR